MEQEPEEEANREWGQVALLQLQGPGDRSTGSRRRCWLGLRKIPDSRGSAFSQDFIKQTITKKKNTKPTPENNNKTPLKWEYSGMK